MSNKFVYSFGDGKAEGNASMKNLLGGKGANLAEMSKMGLPVPLGFTITTDVCTAFYNHNRQFPENLEQQVELATKNLQQAINANQQNNHLQFGNETNPLLFSVRSGARASMPGMMDTILNLGLNDKTVLGLAQNSNNPRFAFDSYRRFIQMYASVVLEIDHHNFEAILQEKKEEHSLIADTQLTAQHLQEIVSLYQQEVLKHTGKPFPQDVYQQLWGAIKAVFDSWMNDRAITYRSLNNIPASWGTAVNVQAMVFGNLGETSATGVAFTRNPSTGLNDLYGEYLINAQGEDVVAGIRTPQSITIAGKKKASAQLCLPWKKQCRQFLPN